LAGWEKRGESKPGGRRGIYTLAGTKGPPENPDFEHTRTSRESQERRAIKVGQVVLIAVEPQLDRVFHGLTFLHAACAPREIMHGRHLDLAVATAAVHKQVAFKFLQQRCFSAAESIGAVVMAMSN
jgi:hypothetical protein